MSDEEYFKRVTISLTDIKICLEYIEKTAQLEDKILLRALHEAIVVSYVRPFSSYNKNYHQILGLKKEFIKKFDNHEKTLHDRICNLRNVINAHSDAKSYGVQISIAQLAEEIKMAFPIQRRITEILSAEDVSILKRCCLKVESYLFEQQTKLKDSLPVGYIS